MRGNGEINREAKKKRQDRSKKRKGNKERS